LDDLRDEADAALRREGFDPSSRRFVRTADLRYFGQAYEVRVEIPDGPVTAEMAEKVADAFHAEHRKLYGYHFRDDPRQQVEWVNLRVTGIGPIRRPEMVEIRSGTGAQPAGRRRVYFDQWEDTAVYSRSELGAGDVVAGPAVIEEFGSTIPIHPGFRVEVDRFGNLLITREVTA
jgi:N-methylhydantoinase A